VGSHPDQDRQRERSSDADWWKAALRKKLEELRTISDWTGARSAQAAKAEEIAHMMVDMVINRDINFRSIRLELLQLDPNMEAQILSQYSEQVTKGLLIARGVQQMSHKLMGSMWDRLDERER
jgi:hypothetical protein